MEYPNQLAREQVGIGLLGLRTYLTAQEIPVMSVGSLPTPISSTTQWGREELVVDYGGSGRNPVLKLSIREGKRQSEITDRVRELLGGADLVEGNSVFPPESGTTMFVIETI
ncbi:hypothetical protein HOD38_05290 [archaeon]|jgi:hypothetical protein|nr:hypothetical protein [archaeon]MBT4397654.1 hypothetical protein [archaeon]MBT4441650.1 hypothetical protein [archaeon]